MTLTDPTQPESDAKRKLPRPRNGTYSYIDEAMSGEFPVIWIMVECSYSRISPSQARKIAALLVRQAAWVEENRGKLGQAEATRG